LTFIIDAKARRRKERRGHRAITKFYVFFMLFLNFNNENKNHESFTANIGVRVRGVRVVRGKLFEN